jgi:hypothetical protein
MTWLARLHSGKVRDELDCSGTEVLGNKGVKGRGNVRFLLIDNGNWNLRKCMEKHWISEKYT